VWQNCRVSKCYTRWWTYLLLAFTAVWNNVSDLTDKFRHGINLCETAEHSEYTGGNATHQPRCSASPRHLGFHVFTISYHLISSSHTAYFGSSTAVSYCLRSHFSFFPIHISYFGLSLCIRVIPLCVMTKCTAVNTAYLLDVAAATCFGLICTNPLSY